MQEQELPTVAKSAVEGVGEWQRQLDGLSPEEIFRWAWAQWGQKLAIFTSFQADGMVVVDLACRLGLSVPILTLDTGRLPEETYDHWDRIRRHYGISIEPVYPDPSALAEMVRRRGPNLFRVDPKARLECCGLRKVEPFRREVGRFSAWISGLRRGQSDTRRSIQAIELDLANAPQGDLVKVSPLVNWTESDVWRYLREKKVPTHPLYEQGYHSIGCAPCSRPLRPAEDPRATRWWWEGEGHRECGLHLSEGVSETHEATP